MKDFNIGEKVIALTGCANPLSQPRIRGQKYVVNSIMYCISCGIQVINVSGKNDAEPGQMVCKCSGTQPTEGLWWTGALHFIREADIQNELDEAVEGEDYKRAVLIRDISILAL